MEIRADERAYYHQLISNMDVPETRVFIYPRLFSLHDMTSDVGLPAIAGADEDDAQISTGPIKVHFYS